MASEAAGPPGATTAFVEAWVAPVDRPGERGVTIVLGAGGPEERRILVGTGFDPRLLREVIATLERGAVAAADGAAP